MTGIGSLGSSACRALDRRRATAPARPGPPEGARPAGTSDALRAL